MGMIFSLVVVLALIGAAYVLDRAGAQFALGVVVPYAAIILFIGGFALRILGWARVPVPFRIPTTCGQEKTLPWIKHNKLESPAGTAGVIGRMLLEVFLFRSLFRNTKADVREGPRLVYGSSKWLWAAGLVFHWSFLFIVLRHFRLFAEPVPVFVSLIESLDGFLQLMLPTFYLTDVFLLLAVTYLFLRRVFIPQVRYISFSADYFPLFLIMAIAVTGVLMRYILRVDVAGIKQLASGLFNGGILTGAVEFPEGISTMFFIHLFLVSTLLAYFPFSKLMHLGGVFMSPTRNLANNSRAKRHINPWNPDVKYHTYEEYEDDFRKVMKAAGLPLEKDEGEE